jgi:hypothetical protein
VDAHRCATRFLHLLAAKGCGLSGDEPYFLPCSDHPDGCDVDRPPLSLVLRASPRVAFGDSLLSIRFLAARAGFFIVPVTGGLARRVGADVCGHVLTEARTPPERALYTLTGVWIFAR